MKLPAWLAKVFKPRDPYALTWLEKLADWIDNTPVKHTDPSFVRPDDKFGPDGW